jgi:hypothetical protein
MQLIIIYFKPMISIKQLTQNAKKLQRLGVFFINWNKKEP